MALRLSLFYKGGLKYETLMEQPISLMFIAFQELTQIEIDTQNAIEAESNRKKMRRTR